MALDLGSRLIGRRSELALLRALYDTTVESKTLAVATLVGPRGIGKTRLVQELVSVVEGDALVLRSACRPYRGATFVPLRELVRQLPQPVEETTDAFVAERLESGRTEDRFWAARKLFEALAAKRPVVVVLEELQWADGTFLDLVKHLVRGARRAPLFVVGLSLRDPGLGETITLGPLSDSEAQELAGDRLPSIESRVDLQRAVAPAAAGNPLFVEQAAALVAEEQQASSGRKLPGSLDDVLAARLERVEPEDLAVLRAAAAVEAPFDDAAVTELVPERSRDEVADRLRALAERSLVRRDGTRFRLHPLVADAVRAATPLALRSRLHEAVTERLEREGEAPEVVAFHLDEAQLHRRAAERFAEAGLLAYARVDLRGDTAPALLERAVELLPATDPLRRELVPTYVAALAEGAEYDRASSVLDEELAQAGDDARLAARLAVERAWVRFHVDPATELAEVVREVQDAVPALEDAGDDAALARAWFVLGTFMFSLGRAAPSFDLFERAVEHARRAADRRAEVDTLWQVAGPLFWGPTPADEGIRRARELRAELPAVTQAEAFMVVLEAIFAAMLGRFDEARALRQEGQALYDELGVLPADVGLPQYSCRLDLLMRDAEAAAAELQDACDAYERRGESGYVSSTAGHLADALERLGRADEAYAATETAARTAAADDFGAQMLWRGVRARVLAHRGDHGQAERLAREAVAIGEPTDFLFLRADSLRDLAEVLALAGKVAEATAAAGDALALYEQKREDVSVSAVRELIERLNVAG